MLDVFNIAKPQNCDIQTFTGAAPYSGTQVTQYSWVKPRGVSHVYIMLIGSGGENNFGASAAGGGSGAVTVWYGSAMSVPDNLIASIPVRQTPGSTQIIYRARTDTILLSANGGVNDQGGQAMTANYFTASGFFQSVAGQNGSGANPGASTTTFLSGGGGSGSAGTGNYGYTTGTGSAGGYFQLQPIIVGAPAVGAGSATSGVAGIGCGGCGSGVATLYGGPGMVLIASW